MRRPKKIATERLTLNTSHIRFLNEQLNQKQALKEELATLRASVATKLYQLSEPINDGN